MSEIQLSIGKLKKVGNFKKDLYIPPSLQKQYCLFYSRFESGNLRKVVMRSPLSVLDGNSLEPKFLEFDLYLSFDTNCSEGLMHWFYFRMLTKNLEVGSQIRLNIRNLHRAKSCYELGMLPRFSHDSKSLC